MGDGGDPARTGVRAGRVVGVLTAGIVVAGLLTGQSVFLERLSTTLQVVDVDPRGSTTPVFALYVAGVALARYALCYVLGSLVGVVYDWLDRPSIAVLAAIVLVVGLVDGFIAAVDTRSAITSLAYVLAWLCYVPVFVALIDDEASYHDGPTRFNDP